MKPKGTSIILSILAIFLLTVSSALAVDLTVADGSGNVGATIDIPITVSDPTGIAGAAFTIEYNTTDLSVESITSDFFGTFASQFAGTEAPTSVEVDGTTYTQPLITNPVDEAELTTGMRVAAARAVAADASNDTLFTLHVKLLKAGVHPISIDATVLDNALAGYETPTAIPYLVGATDATDLAEAFPTIAVSERNIGTVTANAVIVDTDDDGIPDDWENTHFDNDLTVADETSDSDQDGYSDKQEYVNSTDPNDQDPPDGVGYDAATDNRAGTTQSIEAIAGWNWVSFNVLPDDISLEAIFGDNAADVDQVKTQTRSATNIPGFGWVSDDLLLMSSIENGVMFKIKVVEAFTLEVTGTPIAAGTSIDLLEGWTWAGYLLFTCVPTEDGVASILTDLFQVKSQTQSKTKIDTDLMGDLVEMCPGLGYAIKMDAAGTLIY